MYQQMMANYLRAVGGNAPQGLLDQVLQQIQQMNMAQGQAPQQAAAAQGIAGLQQPLQGMQMGGFMRPQMPQGGMGSMQGQTAPFNMRGA